MLNATFTSRAAGISARSRRGVATLAIGLGLAFGVACSPVAVTVPSTPAASTSTPGPVQDRETLSGRLVVVFGDPPPDSGRPAQRRYTLTDQQERHWTLVFDESVYSPPGGVLAFNGKDVDVQGRRTGPERLLVESMRLR